MQYLMSRLLRKENPITSDEFERKTPRNRGVSVVDTGGADDSKYLEASIFKDSCSMMALFEEVSLSYVKLPIKSLNLSERIIQADLDNCRILATE